MRIAKCASASADGECVKYLKSRALLVLAASAVLTVGGWYSNSSEPSHALTLQDTGEQYGWSSPWSAPNDGSTFVRTSGRCGNGNSGQMVLRTSGGNVVAGPITVPHEWKFAQNLGFTIPAGLAAGDYEFYVDCGGQYQIYIAQQVTDGGVAQFVDYIEGVVNPTPVTAAPQSNNDPIVIPSDGNYGDAPVGVEEGGGSSAPAAPKVTRQRLPRSASRTTATTAAPAPVVETTTTAPPVQVEQILPTEITKQEPPKVAINVSKKSDGGLPLAPLAGGAIAIAAVATASIVRSLRRQGMHYPS